jgi:hypothetical protein
MKIYILNWGNKIGGVYREGVEAGCSGRDFYIHTYTRDKFQTFRSRGFAWCLVSISYFLEMGCVCVCVESAGLPFIKPYVCM